MNHQLLESNAALLKQYSQKAIDDGLILRGAIPQADADEYKEHRKRSLRAYAYMNRIVYLLQPYMEDVSYSFALFDADGYLLKLIGNEQVLKRLGAAGIQKGSVWQMEAIGPNAVTVGLREHKTLASVGLQNAHPVLQEFSIYFSPITLLEDHMSPNTETLYGGAALVAPSTQMNEERLLTAVSTANHVMLMLEHSRELYSMIYESLGYARLVVNINQYNQKVIIFYHSKNLFEVLNIPEADICIHPAEAFFDPLPKNKVFWEIVTQLRRVHDEALTLEVKGRKIDCLLTTDPVYQPSINIRSIHIYITTAKNASAHIAKKIGNGAAFTFDNIIGESNKIKTAMRKARLLANSYANTMLLGESGTGKDLFAQAIHNASNRRDKPFIAINCGAIPRELIASELFGYENGAFTGAKRQGNIGKFELADGGTIFLDEIGEMPLDLQATLLRVVEQKQFMRLGSNKLIDVDVKIISATNVDIFSMIEEKRFRADLYYRLSTMHVDIPPLRERGDDVILLAEYFIRRISERIGKSRIMELSEGAKRMLLELPWYGNVRELQNLIDCIVQLYDEPVITVEHIQENMQWKYTPSERDIPLQAPSVQRAPEKNVLTEEEVRQALEACGGNRSQAARMLGIGRRSLYRNLERLHIK